jgi:clan AA aspartic protease (TIGR02281 family)
MPSSAAAFRRRREQGSETPFGYQPGTVLITPPTSDLRPDNLRRFNSFARLTCNSVNRWRIKMRFRSCFAHYAQTRLLRFLTIVLAACAVELPVHASSVFNESEGFTSSPRGHVLVPASIDGSEPLVFVLDTGAAKTFVTPSLAKRLALEQAPGEQASTLGMHGKTENAVVKIQSIAIGEARAADIEAIVLDLDHITRGSWHADGILGMDFLRQFDVRLDFGARLVSFFPAASRRSNCPACPQGIDGIEFETIEPGFIVLPATVDTKPVEAVLDTGSGHSGLNVKAATELGVNLESMPPGMPAGHGFGLQTGPVRLGDTTLSERAALQVMDHPVMEALGLADRPAMLMGTDQLKNLTVTISYGLARLFLQ